jgi:ribonuclease BN (tRNA processing enzyme)
MNIRILGTRGEIPASAPYHSRHSGILINGDLLLDLGERAYLDYKPNWILITHLHPDHAFFVRRSERAEIDKPMYAPESYRDSGIEVKTLSSRAQIGRYDIRPIPSIHSHKVKSQAYLVSTGNKRLLYTADLVWIKKWYHRSFKNLDLVITEASFMRKPGMIRRHKDTGEPYGHAGIPRLIKLFSEFCDHIVLVHYGSWFYRDSRTAHRKVGQLAKEHDAKVDMGYDGMRIDL